MKGVLLALGVLSTLVHRASANVDHVSLYASGGATIIEASATLVLPSAPNPITGTNWCNFAYALTPNAQNGQPVIASPGSRVRTHYKLNSSTSKWDQDLYINDSLVSSVSTSQGQKGNIFYISVECASGSCAAAPAHSWEGVSIVLSSTNPSFKHSGSWDYGATGGEMSTSDGGKTWTFTTLNIPATTD
ncbi:hypothetical protein GGR55DRAFT_701833 [Xylaria sp. FL0064]|nr:hypothetical protein GGR55DRAFT_701833 [Xylaria sp. FL0064]